MGIKYKYELIVDGGRNLKYGIDVNNELACKIVVEKIKENGNVVVDLTVEKWNNRGQEVFKKVLLANITNIDFYVGIEFVKNIDKYKVFYSDNEYSKRYSLKIFNKLNTKVNNSILEDGKHLYLIKNMSCPGIYIKIPINDKDDENIKVINYIVEELIDSK